jgi:hypothetical protein
MKKTMLTVLWMLAFFALGLCLYAGFIILMRPFFHSGATDSTKAIVVMIADLLCPIGLPVVALLLGIFGKLPGTQGKQDLVPA